MSARPLEAVYAIVWARLFADEIPRLWTLAGGIIILGPAVFVLLLETIQARPSFAEP